MVFIKRELSKSNTGKALLANHRFPFHGHTDTVLNEKIVILEMLLFSHQGFKVILSSAFLGGQLLICVWL